MVLPNGMTIFLTENHELPLISGSAMIRGGSDSEPAEKTGLVDLYGSTWRTGGTEKLSGDALDDSLEARAAKVETSGGDDDTSISFNCLKGDFPDVLGIFVDLLQHPAFREDKLSLAKKEMYSDISRRNDETDSIAEMQTDILGYGKQSAYARVPEYATVRAVTREDLLQWHQQHVVPNNIILGVVGDFDSKEMEATLRKAFGDWPSGEKVEEPKVEIAPAKPGIYLVDKSDVDQSEIRMIGLGIERKNPDYFALQVMNEIFGGGFSSRLFINLRTKAGLAYSVGGGVGSGWDHPGLTILEIGTKTETTVEAIKGMWDQVELLKKEPPTEVEMKRAKDQILNSFIFNFDTPAKVLHEQEVYDFYGYPSDFLEKYRAGVEKVTAADVLRVANQYLHREELKVLVVGNAGGFEKQLAALGPVTPIDITIPSPEAKAGGAQDSAVQPAAMPGSMAENAAGASGGNAEGKAAIARLDEAMGGAAKVNSVRTLGLSLTMTQEGATMRIEQSTVYPDKQAQRIVYSSGMIWQVVSPEAAFISGAMVEDLTPSQRDAVAAAAEARFPERAATRRRPEIHVQRKRQGKAGRHRGNRGGCECRRVGGALVDRPGRNAAAGGAHRGRSARPADVHHQVFELAELRWTEVSDEDGDARQRYAAGQRGPPRYEGKPRDRSVDFQAAEKVTRESVTTERRGSDPRRSILPYTGQLLFVASALGS